MKYKIIILFIAINFLTGCSVNYELDIDRVFQLSESITLNATNIDEQNQIEEFNQYIPIDYTVVEPAVYKEKSSSIEYYNIEKENNNIKFKYNYDIAKFNNNMFAKNCYEYITVMKTDEEIILSTSKEFLCFEKFNNLDDVTITITSKYKLKKTNADITEKHKYTWNINRNNANNKYIYLSLDSNDLDLTLWEKILEGEYTNIFTISLLLFVIGLIIYLILKKRSESRDKI